MSDVEKPSIDVPEKEGESFAEQPFSGVVVGGRTGADDAEPPVEALGPASRVEGSERRDEHGEHADDTAGRDEASSSIGARLHRLEVLSRGAGASEPRGSRGFAAGGRRRRQILLVGIIAFSLGSGGVGYGAWRQLQSLEARFEARSRENANEIRSTVQAELSAQRHGLGGAMTQLETVTDRVEQVDQAVGAFRTEVDTLSMRLAEAVESDPTELLFAELDYLLRVANHRIALEHDREGAILALTRAERRLAGIDSPMLDPVRAQLVADRAALEAAPAPALDDVFGAIATLIDSIDGLRDAAGRIAPEGESPTVEERQETGWQAFLSAISHDLAQFVVVKRADGAIAPQLIPDQDYLVRENLRLSLENARSAALRRDTGNFRRSLEEAERWLSGYFPPGESIVATMSSEIRRLVGLDLQPRLPDISGSIELVARLSGASILRDAGTPGSVAPDEAMGAEAEAEPASDADDSHSEGLEPEPVLESVGTADGAVAPVQGSGMESKTHDDDDSEADGSPADLGRGAGESELEKTEVEAAP